jgi:hypothetical protein
LAKIQPPPGPIDPAKLPKPMTIEPLAKNWAVGAGKVKEEKRALVVDDEGGDYWLVSKENLPKNFQITIPCAVGFLKGRQQLWESQRTLFRALSIRFGTPDTTSMILEDKGYRVVFTQAYMMMTRQVGKESKVVGRANVGNTDKPMVLTITCNQGEITVAVDSEKLLSYKDPAPLPTNNKICIGGFISRLVIGTVEIVDLDAGKPKEAPTQPAPSKPMILRK